MRTSRRMPALVLAGLLLLPYASLAQPQGRVIRVGILIARGRAESDYLGKVSDVLREVGYIEGKNLVVEWRYAGGDYERLKNLAAELARIPVDVIVTEGTPSALAAKEVAKTIPNVFMNVGDPVAVGLVKSLAHPGGNRTGLALSSNDMPAKQMEMLGSVVPGLARVAVLTNPANPNTHLVLKGFRAAAIQMRRQILELGARTPGEIADAFAVIRRERPGALVVLPDSFLFQYRARIAEEAAAVRLPSMGTTREYAEAGGLMAYGPSRLEILRRAATYVDRIVRGANPAELPVELPTKLELVMNRKTAKVLGLKLPPDLVVLVDKAIE